MFYDLLARIKNAQSARKESFQMPFSTFDLAVARVLAESGYIKEAEKRGSAKKPLLEIKLKYSAGHPAMTDFKIVSKPSRHIYSDYRSLKPVRQGYGMAIISTPKGIISGKQAKQDKVGGEYLCEIW
ncbi:MAG: 30S ribosomal protein S8 [Candidatus Liptonbacteria bacterium]